jgi:glucose-1-phosphate cytidylyltransferase
MKAVILAGGRGSRIAEESHLRPKPMIEIGGKPILWHIMKIYAEHGITEFVICLGYKGHVIKEYFLNYFLHASDLTIDLASNSVNYRNARGEPWKVSLVDTGETTLTGGRVKRASEVIGRETFCLTYGDGVADVNVSAEIDFHRQHGLLATMTVVRPPARFGTPVLVEDRVVEFEEKSQAREGRINGGFFVLEPEVLDLIDGDDTPFETTPLQRLASMRQLAAWKHDGFWQPMDTLRERELLEALWADGRAPWRTW